MSEPWKIEEGKGGVFFIVDHNGTRIARVYGLRDQKLKLAEAIASLPVLAEIMKKRESQWQLVGIESNVERRQQ